MDEKELRELLRERLHMELQIFKDSVLQRGKEDIFKASYETEIYVNLYEIFAVHTDNLQGDTIRGLLNLRFGILEAVYQGWLGKEDGFFDELKAYACRELENISETADPYRGKDDKDGKRLDKAA
ncbi:MAG: DUF3848 domain-containing protein [Lachnospiraceae bacterium]|nr:DUF3848 domain-containing protein [Lachnospiraceae bacterium]